jgi:hypothetical protein
MITNFPQGVSSYGVPMVGAGTIPASMGKYYFVNSRTGSNGNNGLTITNPFATLAYAVSVAPAYSTIVVGEGHTESITAAAGIDFNRTNITVVGLGTGGARPTLTWSTATTADMDIDAANISISNFNLDFTGIDAVAAAIDVNATDFTLANCNATTTITAAQCTVPVLADANASRMRILNNTFFGSTTTGTTCSIQWVGGSEQQIRNNVFIGAYTTTLGALNNLSSTSGRQVIDSNYIINATASSTVAMTFVSTSTGIISNNRMGILSGPAPVVGAAMTWGGGNYYSAALATAGTLI